MSRDRIQRFEVVAELGSGGMGTVYRARDPHLQRDVAIKVLALHGAPPAELSTVRTVDLRAPGGTSEDLLAEARVMAQLSHPNVLPVFEVGLDGREVFLVMELVEGSNLRTWLRDKPPAAAVARAFAQAARGLAAAHGRGVVHRDFKPDNVLIGDDGRVRVADFGLSLLERGGDQLIQWGDVAGTPEYMAPEQLGGAPATPESDVYSFARSLAEALTGVRGELADLEERLREADVDPDLRALIRAGLAEDPAERPALAAFLAELEGRRRPGWHRLAFAAAAVAGAAVLSLVTPASSNDVGACERATVAYGAPWDAAKRAEVVRVVGEEIAALVDQRLGDLAADRHAACVARAAGETTAAETASWLSCVERRRVELAATVRQALATPHADRRRFGDIIFALHLDCRGHTDAPLPAEPAPALALVERFTLLSSVPRARIIDADLALERTAAALGEREVEARSAFVAGLDLRDHDQIDAADHAFERAHRIAQEIHSYNVELRSLIEDASMAAITGDLNGASRLVGLAAELIEKPAVTDWTRARALIAIGRVQSQKADYKAALATYDRAAAALAHSGRLNVSAEITLRTDRVSTMFGVDRIKAIEVARDAVKFVREQGGEKSIGLAVALDLYAGTLMGNKRLADAIASRTEALSIYVAQLPPTSSKVIRARRALADLMQRQGRYAEARVLYRAAWEAAQDNEALRAERYDFLTGLATSSCNLGDLDEGLRLFQQVIEEAIVANGKHHPRTLALLVVYTDYALEAGRVEDATTRFAQVVQGYRDQPDIPALEVAKAEGSTGVRVALAHGKPREAEALARKSLATVRAIPHAEAKDREWIEHGLASALIDQRRWADALEAADASLADARAAETSPEYVAVMQISRARALLELGRRDEARAVAREASDVLAHIPGQASAAKDVAALLARLH